MVGPLFIADARKARCKSQLTPYTNAQSLGRTEKMHRKYKAALACFFERFDESKRSRSMRPPMSLNRRENGLEFGVTAW